MPYLPTHKPFIIPLFIPHAGCPYRCVFCNQTSTTGTRVPVPTMDTMRAAIKRFLGYRQDPARHSEIAFYGGNFLGLATDHISALLEMASAFVRNGSVNGIRFSTRPDTIDARRLKLIAKFPVTAIELGVQSLNNKVLANSRRGYTDRDVYTAAALIGNEPYAFGIQMMIGLPGDTLETSMTSGEHIVSLRPDFVRIYPTLVIKGSPLERWYRQGRYTPLELDTAVELAKRLLVLFTRNAIRVIRMGLQPTNALNTDAAVIAGPFHPAFGALVHSALWYEKLCNVLSLHGPETEARLIIGVHPRMLSHAKGHSNENIEKLTRHTRINDIQVVGEAQLSPDTIVINGQPYRPFR